jgi:hypothetical protein
VTTVSHLGPLFWLQRLLLTTVSHIRPLSGIQKKNVENTEVFNNSTGNVPHVYCKSTIHEIPGVTQPNLGTRKSTKTFGKTTENNG